MKRRLAAVVLNFLFLSASLPGVSPGCVAGVEAGSERVHSEAVHHAAHASGADRESVSAPPAHESKADDAPRDHQHERSHCVVTMTCSMVASVDATTAVADTIPATADDRWAPPAAPHSVATGPEPPPPRG